MFIISSSISMIIIIVIIIVITSDDKDSSDDALPPVMPMLGIEALSRAPVPIGRGHSCPQGSAAEAAVGSSSGPPNPRQSPSLAVTQLNTDVPARWARSLEGWGSRRGQCGGIFMNCH